MYHEEKVIEGRLCWCSVPGCDWTAYTPESLTVALTAERARVKDLEDKLYLHMQKLAAVKNAVG